MKSRLQWLGIVLLLLILIVIPFFFFGESVNNWVDVFLEKPHADIVAGFVLASLLASDVFLPIPSSLISTGCGYLLGLWQGVLVSCIGMSIGCAIGFSVASVVGRPVVRQLVGEEALETLEGLGKRYGDWILIMARPVPVLAEASVLVAGMGGVSWFRFMLLTTLSNAGISCVYATIGVYSLATGSFLIAFAASVLLPGLIMLFARRWGGSTS